MAASGSPAPGAAGDPVLDLDWDLALEIARRTTPPGPRVTRAERSAVVALLHEAAAHAPQRVGELTGLEHEARALGQGPPARVVDRDGARRAAVETLRGLSPAGASPGDAGSRPPDTVGDDEPARRPGGLADRASRAARGGARRLAAGEAAAALAAVSTRLLGEVLPGRDPEGGPLTLLVAPNVLALQRREDLDLADLATWVALHESVHAVQLAAAPWLADHLAAGLRGVVEAVLARDPGTVRERAARLSAVLALLEGHAEASLDGVGVAELSSVHRLRAAVGPGRAGTLTALLERLRGARSKASQHADGAAFVRAVLAGPGHEGLRALWRDPSSLPTPRELADPGAWQARVLDRTGRGPS